MRPPPSIEAFCKLLLIPDDWPASVVNHLIRKHVPDDLPALFEDVVTLRKNLGQTPIC